jgi:hypothetical protein
VWQKMTRLADGLLDQHSLLWQRVATWLDVMTALAQPVYAVGQQLTEMARHGSDGKEKEHSMTNGQARTVWADQCAATSSIRARFGARSALDYLVSEKLMDFAEAAGERREFARELPAFVAEVRRIFSWQELNEHLSRMERELELAGPADDADPDDDFADPPALVAARRQQFDRMKQMLLAELLGTS